MTNPLGLHHCHETLGGRFGEVDLHLVPLDYGDVPGEHRAVREGAGLVDRSHRGAIEATGRDRAAFLHGMLSSDVKGLTPGQGAPSAFLDVHGKLAALLTVHCLADRLILETDRALVEPTRAALDRFLFSERVELEDVSGREAILTVAGPAARERLGKILAAPLPGLAPAHHVGGRVDGAELRVVRNDESGEEGYDLWIGADRASALWDRLAGLGCRPVGHAAWDVLRTEAGGVRYGVDVDASTLLLEAPLEGAYSLGKGCYLGQEVVARITYRGHVNRKIVGFTILEGPVPQRGDRILVDGREVGRCTSAVHSPTLGRPIALGFLRREHWEPGTRVVLAGDRGSSTAIVTALPFYRRPRDG